MKILYLIDTLYNAGGMERILILKANRLASAFGYEVTFVTNHQKGRPTFFPLGPQVKLLDIGCFLRLPIQVPLYLRKLDDVVKAEKPDIIIDLHLLTMGKLKERYPGVVVMSEFHFCHEMFRIRKKTRRMHRMEKAVSRLDCFVVLTQEDKKAWEPFCPHIVQIYNPSTFIQDDGVRAPLEAKRCISGGRFESQKNYSRMIELWSRLHPRHPDWVLDLYGNGKEKKKIEKQIARLGLQDSVRLHPASRQIREEMLGSSIYLMTSLFEGFPLVLAESASIGLPCVAFRCPCGPGEFIRDGVDGFTAHPADSQEWIAKVEKLMDNSELRKKMGENSLEKAKDFTEKLIIPRWDALFRELVKKKHA